MRNFTDLEYGFIKANKGFYFRNKCKLSRGKLVWDCCRHYAYRSSYTLHAEILPAGENELRFVISGQYPVFGEEFGFRYYDILNKVVNYGEHPVFSVEDPNRVVRMESNASDEGLRAELSECLRGFSRMVEEMTRAFGSLEDGMQRGYRAAGSFHYWAHKDDMMV